MSAISKKSYLFPLFIFLLFSLAFSPYHALLKSQLVADDASYLSHGFTLGLDFNFAYQTLLTNWLATSGIPAHPVGPGLLAAPFIALFSLIDKLWDLPVIQDHSQYLHSWSLFGFVFASNFYFVLGLYLYKQGLKSLGFNLNSKLLILLACSFGALYYVLFRPVMGHAFEFFTLALCFWSTSHIINLKDNFVCYFLLAASVVLTIAIRPANINILLLPMIMLLTMKLYKNVSLDYKCFILSYGFALLLLFIPYGFMNHYLYGVFMPSTEVLYGFRPLTMPPLQGISQIMQTLFVLMQRLPQIFTVIFSSEFGLLYTSPILLIGPLCYIYWHIRMKINWMTVLNLSMILIYCGLPVAIILFWQSPGDAYAFRFLFCLFPIALLGFALFNQLYGTRWVRQGLIALSSLALLANILFALSPQLMYHEDTQNAFGLRGSGSARGFNSQVIKAVAMPSTWIHLVSTRLPGFYAIAIMKYWDVKLDNYIPATLQSKWEKVTCCYVFPPGRVYLQTGILGILFIGGLILISLENTSENLRRGKVALGLETNPSTV